eukprot:9716999-Alexandrium_andersonii.AAC.1
MGGAVLSHCPRYAPYPHVVKAAQVRIARVVRGRSRSEAIGHMKTAAPLLRATVRANGRPIRSRLGFGAFGADLRF